MEFNAEWGDKFKGLFKPSIRRAFHVAGDASGLAVSPLNMAFLAGTAAYGFATAPRGHALSQAVSKPLGWGVASFVAGMAGTMVGGPATGYAASIAAGFMYEHTVGKSIDKTVQSFVDFGHNAKGMNFGGHYTDTNNALTMRQVAAREMSGSLMNARQWLGSEASFMAD